MEINNPRMAARITTIFFLRQASTVADIFDGDLLLGLVFFGIGAANNRLILQAPSVIAEMAQIADGPLPDHRRPISVSALGRSLGLPYETTRRYVAKLMDRKMCVRTKDGLMITDEARMSERVAEAVKRSNADLRWFAAMLRRINVDINAIG